MGTFRNSHNLRLLSCGRFAIEMFNNFQRSLNVYSCSSYSQIWSCANCSDAYKRWLCSQVHWPGLLTKSKSFSYTAWVQVYHKMYLPGTDRTEEGFVGGKDYSDEGQDPPEHFSYTTACSTLVPETQEIQIRLCNGWASRPIEDLIATPEIVCVTAHAETVLEVLCWPLMVTSSGWLLLFCMDRSERC